VEHLEIDEFKKISKEMEMKFDTVAKNRQCLMREVGKRFDAVSK
jgi:hypothetical protein